MPMMEYTPALTLDDPEYESGWTIDQLVDTSYFLCDESRNDVLKESQVIDLINMGYRIIYNKLGYPFARASYIVYPGTSKFELVDTKLDPDGRSEISYMHLYKGDEYLGELKESDIPTPPTKVGQPKTFWQDNEVICLDTDPDVAYRIVVRYRHQPEMMEKTDTPPVPHDQQQLVCLYVAYMFKLKDDQVGISDRWRDQWESGLAEVRTWKTGNYSYADYTDRVV